MTNVASAVGFLGGDTNSNGCEEAGDGIEIDFRLTTGDGPCRFLQGFLIVLAIEEGVF